MGRGQSGEGPQLIERPFYWAILNRILIDSPIKDHSKAKDFEGFQKKKRVGQ